METKPIKRSSNLSLFMMIQENNHLIWNNYKNGKYTVFSKNYVFSQLTATHSLHVGEPPYPRKNSEYTLTTIC